MRPAPRTRRATGSGYSPGTRRHDDDALEPAVRIERLELDEAGHAQHCVASHKVAHALTLGVVDREHRERQPQVLEHPEAIVGRPSDPRQHRVPTNGGNVRQIHRAVGHDHRGCVLDHRASGRCAGARRRQRSLAADQGVGRVGGQRALAGPVQGVQRPRVGPAHERYQNQPKRSAPARPIEEEEGAVEEKRGEHELRSRPGGECDRDRQQCHAKELRVGRDAAQREKPQGETENGNAEGLAAHRGQVVANQSEVGGEERDGRPEAVTERDRPWGQPHREADGQSL